MQPSSTPIPTDPNTQTHCALHKSKCTLPTPYYRTLPSSMSMIPENLEEWLTDIETAEDLTSES